MFCCCESSGRVFAAGAGYLSVSGAVLGVMHIIQVVGSVEMGYGHAFQASTSCFASGHASLSTD